MSVNAKVVTVGTSATLIDTGGGTVSDKKTVILSTASGAIYLGGSGVTTAAGLPYDSSSPIIGLDLGPGDDLYAIAASEQTVRVLSTRDDA